MNTDTRTMAAEYVDRTHMCDWTQNQRRQELAEAIGLTNHWQSHAAYLEARTLAGMDRPTLADVVARSRARSDTDPQWRGDYR